MAIAVITVLEFDITITDTDVEYVPTRVDLHGLVAPDYITDRYIAKLM